MKQTDRQILFRKKQQVFICILACVVLGGFTLFRYLPLHKKTELVEKARADQIGVIAKGATDIQRLSEMKEHLRRLRSSIGNYEREIPEQKELGGFLQEITNLMNKHNLKEQIVQPGKEIELQNLNCIPVSIQCKGKLSQVFEFYKSMEKMERLLRIEQVILENEKNFSGELNIRTTAFIYYRPKTTQR